MIDSVSSRYPGRHVRSHAKTHGAGRQQELDGAFEDPWEHGKPLVADVGPELRLAHGGGVGQRGDGHGERAEEEERAEDDERPADDEEAARVGEDEEGGEGAQPDGDGVGDVVDRDVPVRVPHLLQDELGQVVPVIGQGEPPGRPVGLGVCVHVSSIAA